MDKLTLTRQFGMIQFGIFLGRYREELECNRFMQKKRFSIDSNALPMG